MVDEAAKAAGIVMLGCMGRMHAYPRRNNHCFQHPAHERKGAAFFTSSDHGWQYGQRCIAHTLNSPTLLRWMWVRQHWSNLAPDTKVNANVTSELAAKKEKTNEGLNKIMFDLFGEEPSR